MNTNAGNQSRELMFPKAIGDIQNAIETLDKALTELELRLQPISQLSDKVPFRQDTNKNPVPPEAPMIQELFLKTDAIRMLRSRVEEMLQRLEV